MALMLLKKTKGGRRKTCVKGIEKGGLFSEKEARWEGKNSKLLEEKRILAGFRRGGLMGKEILQIGP